jgi:sugar/nucleoside kinase (ribokinase family)
MMPHAEWQHETHYDLVVVGELNVDLILRGDVIPAFGQVEQLLDDAQLTLGSSSAIFACGAARLGLRVAFLGKVGDDTFGHFLLRELTAQKVATDAIVITPQERTGLSVILSRDEDRAILTYSGTIATLRYTDLRLDLFDHARHLHLGGFFLLDTLRPDVSILFADAKGKGLSTSLDTNYDPSGQWDGGLTEVLQHTDVLLPNETELLAITGASNVETALAALAATVPTIAVKRGARGALAQQGAARYAATSLDLMPLDTTGAGDSFDAGFLYGFLAGWPAERALKLGTVCGALSTQGIGGIAAQPTLAEALAALS